MTGFPIFHQIFFVPVFIDNVILGSIIVYVHQAKSPPEIEVEIFPDFIGRIQRISVKNIRTLIRLRKKIIVNNPDVN